MKKSKYKWKILLIIGVIPFLAAILYALDSAINGFSGSCWWQCDYYYGLPAFKDSIVLYSYFLFPTYIIGIILIILSIIKLRKSGKNN